MDIDILLDNAISQIRQYLPDQYEIDDISWDETMFQICIFDVAKFPGRLADRFRFGMHPEETEEELITRFNDRLTEYCKSWR